MDYKSYSDEQLAKVSKNDSVGLEVLMERYKTIINSQARKYFLHDGDIEDLVQEAMIGLFKAVMSFNEKGNFKTYAYTCIKNNIISAVKKSNTDKNRPMIDYVSLSSAEGDDEDKNIYMSDKNYDPERTYIEKESIGETKEIIDKTLSKFENKILGLYLQGFSYEDIGNKTGKNKKSIDNAIQRLTKKLRKALS